MRIVEIYAEEFGCLADRRFSFEKGLVVVQGDNESGKSTLQALFRFLFYGFPRRAGADGEERDKRLSHKGRRAAGAIRFVKDGEEYLLRRQVILRGGLKREQVSEELSVVRVSDGKEQEMGDRAPGEYFLGMPWELYQSSFCARQQELSGVGTPEASGALGDFLFRDGEHARIDKACEILTRARRELQYQRGKGGRIAELEQEAAVVQQELAKADANAVTLHEKRDAMTRYAKMEADLSHDVAVLEKKLKAAEADEMLARFDAWHAAVREEREAARLLHEANAALGSDDASEQFLTAVREDIDACERVKTIYVAREDELARVTRAFDSLPVAEESAAIEGAGGALGVKAELVGLERRSCRFLCCGAVALLLAIALSVVAALLSPVLFAGVALFMGAAIALFLCVAATGKRKRAFLARIGVTKESSLEVLLDRYERGKEKKEALLHEQEDRAERVDEAKRRCMDAVRVLFSRIEEMGLARPSTYAEAKRAVAELEARIHGGRAVNAEKENALARAAAKRQAYEKGLDPASEADWRARRAALPTPEKDREELARELEFKRGARESATKAYTAAATDVAALSASVTAPALLRRREGEIGEELARARFRHAAVVLAEEMLLKAGEQLREELVPRVAKRASEIFAETVGEADRTLLLEQDFSVKIMTPSGVYSLSHFSVGCRDAAWLAIRLALSEVISEEPLPLLFDEVTAHLDDARAARFLRALHDYCGEKRQGILFTCHTREATLLGGKQYCRILL